jgi:hypothetical protein
MGAHFPSNLHVILRFETVTYEMSLRQKVTYDQAWGLNIHDGK